MFICHGNVCRSPFAAYLFEQKFPPTMSRPSVSSAGFIGPGRNPPATALASALRRGIDMSAHVSSILLPGLVREGDLVVVMDADQARAVRRLAHGAQVLVLGDLDPGGISRRGIADPWGGGDDEFDESYDRIERCVDELLLALRVADGGERIRHHFTVDVEEWFQVSAMEPFVPRPNWADQGSRVAIGIHRLLELLARHDARGTFFTLGLVAERNPEIVREIAAAGHEIASHGWGHERVTTLSPKAFRESLRRSREILEDLTGQSVYGYRAPSFSVVRGGEWALDALVEEGYRYDSSLYPAVRKGYGYAGGRRDPHVIRRVGGPLHEVPPATLTLAGRVLPAGGGAYFRHFPYAFIRSAFLAAERRGAPATFYIHPWELDHDQPRLDVPLLTRGRHYGGLGRTIPRLERFLSEFRFQTIAQTLGFGIRGAETVDEVHAVAR